MMPGLDGIELLRLLRRQSQVPVIMLTARTAEGDRITGLDAGADHYLPKPFGPDELLARIRAVLRRTSRVPSSGETIEADGIKLITKAREVVCEGSALAVTTVEYDILEYLVRAAGRIVSRDELTAALYRRQATPFDLEAEARGCQLVVRSVQPAILSGERELLHRAVENIVRNAIRHTAEGTTVEIALELRGEMAVASVRDHGPGVPEAVLTEIFKPFFRVEDDRSRSSGGVGLGLAIARRAVEVHQGTIAAQNAHPGLLISISLPHARAPIKVPPAVALLPA